MKDLKEHFKVIREYLENYYSYFLMAIFYYMQISKFLLSKNIQIWSLYDTFHLRNIEWTTTRSLSKEYNTAIFFAYLLKL